MWRLESLNVCARPEPGTRRTTKRTREAAARRLLLPVDNMRQRLVVVEIGILLLRVAGEADVGSNHDLGILVGVLGPHAMAVLALNVHELGRGLLGGEPARLPVAHDV